MLLQGSAVGYYGARGDEAVDRGRARRATTSWPTSAVEWEASTAEAESLGVRRAVLRTGIVLAREGRRPAADGLPFRLIVGGPLGDGRQWFPWIHVADEVGAIRFLLEREDARGALQPDGARSR